MYLAIHVLNVIRRCVFNILDIHVLNLIRYDLYSLGQIHRWVGEFRVFNQPIWNIRCTG